MLVCPCCSMDLRFTLEHIGNSSCPECGDTVNPSSAGHGALCMFSCCPESPYHVQCLSRVAVAEGDPVFCPRCQGGRRDHVDVGWFRRMCHINGVEWPVPPQVTCVLCMNSMGEDRVAVPCCNQEVHVGCLAQSFNACGARCPFCVQHCASMLSLRFSRQLLFSMDIQWTSLVSPPTVEPIPWSRVVSRAHQRICRCCVAAVWVLHHSSNQASTDAWSGLKCGNSRRWLGICSGSVSHVFVPFRQVTSQVAHRSLVECAVHGGRFSIE